MQFKNRFVFQNTCIMIKTTIMTIIIFFLFLSFNNLFAEQATITLNPSIDPRVEGHKIYYGVSTHIIDVIDIGNETSYTVYNLQKGVDYYFVATAYDEDGIESEYSEILTFRVPENQ